MPDGATLPPVVAQLLGDAESAIRAIEEVQAALSALDGTTVSIGINQAALDSSIADAKAKLASAFGDENAGVDIHVNTASLATAEAEVQATLSRAVTVPIDVSLASALASGAVADAVAGGGGGGGGLFARLYGASGIPFLRGLAAFGTLGSLGGFGAEHVITTGLGIAGSAVGGLIGGAGLAAGGLATTGVGMGTDLAGIGQAAGDIKNVTSAMDALNNAIEVYGANSTQAATAQAQLNAAENAFNPIAKANVIAAAQQIQTFKAMFDQYTGAAESTGAAIINQLVQVGEKFLPTIGAFAAKNMTIIQAALVPLENWLQGPGLAIFTHLEQEFTSRLPAAMGAFDQAIEFVLKGLNYLSTFTGGLMQKLDEFFTKLNSPQGFAQWESWMSKMIDDFHTWWDFLKQIAITIYDIFSQSAGLGSGIIQDLTQMLKLLDNWLTSTGKSSVGLLFSTHKSEIMDLIQAVAQLAGAFGEAYIAIAPLVTMVATVLIKAFVDLLDLIEKIPGGSWALGFAFLALTTYAGGLKAGLVILKGALLDLLANGLIALGGPFATVGGWLKGLGGSAETTATQMTGAVDEMTAAITSAVAEMTAAIDRLVGVMGGAATSVSADFEEIATAAQTSASEVVAADSEIDVANGSLAEGALLGGGGTLATKTPLLTAGAGAALFGTLIGTQLINQATAGVKAGSPTTNKVLSAGTDILSGAGVGLAAGLAGGPLAPISVPIGVITGAIAGAAVAFRKPIEDSAVAFGHQVSNVATSFGHGVMTAWHSLFGGGPTQSQKDYTALLNQIQSHVAAIHSLGAKDVTVAGIKAAVAAHNIVTHPHTLGSGGVLNVADKATAQIASLGSKDQTIGRLAQNVTAMGQLFGKGSPAQIAAIQALNQQVETWFPQLAKDTNVKSELSSIATKQQQLQTTVEGANTQAAQLKQIISALSGGKSLSDLESDSRNLQNLLHDPPKGADIHALHTDLNNVNSTIQTVKYDTGQLKNMQTLATNSENQLQQLGVLKAGLTGALTNVQIAVASAGKLTDTDFGKIDAHLGNVTIAKVPAIASKVTGTFRSVLTVTS